MNGQIEATKKCPFCAETIKAEAVVCRYCNRDLRPVATPPSVAPPAKKSSSSPAAIIILILIIIIGVAIASSGGRSPSSSSAPPVKTTYSILYRVTGTGTSKASLTYENETGDTEQREVNLPWTKTFSARPGAYLYISAQNDNDSGSIKCEIVVDNVVAKQASSSGAYVIATCSGRL